MIYTISMAPGLNCIQRVESFKKGTFNRGFDPSIQPGGKGINISIMLKRMGVDSKALGFVGGFVGEYIIDTLKSEGISHDFVRVTDNSRINFRIVSDDDSSETVVNGSGPFVSLDKVEEFMETLEDLGEDDMVVVDGLVPPGVSQDAFERILALAQERRARVVIDASDKFLLESLAFHPFLIKPNHYELSEIFQRPMEDEESILDAMTYLRENGAQNIIVSRGGESVLFMDEKGRISRRRKLSDKPISKFGAGDAMVAGFICGYQLYDDYDKAIDIALACGTARAMKGRIPNKSEVIYYLDKLSKIQ